MNIGVLIFIIYVIVSAVSNKNKKKTQHTEREFKKDIKRQVQKVHKIEELKRSLTSIEKELPDIEGGESEDRTKIGSLKYSDLHKSNEGIETEGEIKKATEYYETIDDRIIADEQTLSYDDLQRSIIMAEVLGKPRALKKSIR